MNLIVTCARHLESETKDELKEILKKFGDDEPEIIETEFSGILTAKTRLDPVEVVNQLRELILDEPWKIRYCLRIIPIYENIQSTLEEIEKKVESLIQKISNYQTYRITIEKRFSSLSSAKIISSIAKKLSNKVSLENPDWIILVEILGEKTGISVIKQKDILSVEKIKRSISE